MPRNNLDRLAGRRVTGDEVLRTIVNAKPRRFKAPPVRKPPGDLADQLDWAADGADEIGLSDDGLRGGSALLRRAAAEIRRLRGALERGKGGRERSANERGK
jgi:hypothetical protein